MKDALTIHRMLLERETLHEIVRLPRAISHADELPKVLELPAERCLVTHVYTVGSTRREARALAGVIVAAGQEPVPEMIRRRLGARTIRHARADQINAATEYTAHLVCPLLLPPVMRLFIDRSILAARRTGDGRDDGRNEREHGRRHGRGDDRGDDVVYTAAGEPFTALGIRLADLCALSGAEPIDLPVAAAATGPGRSTLPPVITDTIPPVITDTITDTMVNTVTGPGTGTGTAVRGMLTTD